MKHALCILSQRNVYLKIADCCWREWIIAMLWGSWRGKFCKKRSSVFVVVVGELGRGKTMIFCRLNRTYPSSSIFVHNSAKWFSASQKRWLQQQPSFQKQRGGAKKAETYVYLASWPLKTPKWLGVCETDCWQMSMMERIMTSLSS
jgi:hypothetical protein